MNKYNLVLAGVLSACSMALPQAWANTDNCDASEHHYLQCDNQLGWYLGGDIGFANTSVSQHDIDRFFLQTGFDARSIKIDDDDTAWSIFAGYQFNSNFALEIGHLDLGERRVDFVGASTDRQAFFNNVEHIYPQSAEGTTFNLVGSYLLAEDIKLSGKLGYFDWSGDYRTNENNTQVGSDRISDQDLWYGIELNYRLNENWQAYTSFSKIKLSRDRNTLFTFGLRYYFGAESDTPKTRQETSESVPAAPLVNRVESAPVTPLDSDADGVNDELDNCPNSDSKFAVDSKGCTLMAEQSVDYRLVLRYDNDSAVISAEDQEKVKELVEFINKHNIEALTIYGHTSAPGSKAYNQRLSERRAASLAQALTKQYQITPEQIKTVGKGETELLNPADTEQADIENRRVELSVSQVVLMPVEKK